jgi:hypothetical protein
LDQSKGKTMSDFWWADLGDETLTETAWERQMNIAGIEAFEQARYTASGQTKKASESRTGQKVLRKFLERAADAILEMQKNLLGIHRIDRTLRATVLLVPEEVASMLVLRALIDRTYGIADQDKGYNYQILSKEIAKSVETELNFRHWLNESQKQSAKYAKEKGLSKVPKSLAERLIEEQGVSRASFFRWKQTFDELNTYEWSTLEQHYCGEALLLTVIEALPEAFEISIVTERGKTTKHVRMKPEFRKYFDDMEAKIARLQVVRKPMIARPRRWTKGETE